MFNVLHIVNDRSRAMMWANKVCPMSCNAITRFGNIGFGENIPGITRGLACGEKLQ